ncbi:MAG: DUF1611 domain-containing protein [Rhizobacter sp.]
MKNEQTRILQNTLQNAKWAFSTRRVIKSDAKSCVTRVEDAVSGDLVIGRIMSVGSHPRLQLADGRPSDLYEGDLIVVACGARYASDQFEGVATLSAEGSDLLAGGGCLGEMRQKHARMKAPTRVEPLGLLCDEAGRVINLQRYAAPRAPQAAGLTVIGVVGASMNAGKTSAVASFVHGLESAGYRVAAVKATGTGAFGDWLAHHDAGASFVTDFTDTGMVSTYLQPLPRLVDALNDMLGAACAAECEVAVVEFADGVLQRETHALLARPDVREKFAGFLFAAPDALAALGGQHHMASLGLKPAAITGLISASPLNAQEAQNATGLKVLSRETLRDPAQAASLLHEISSVAATC